MGSTLALVMWFTPFHQPSLLWESTHKLLFYLILWSLALGRGIREQQTHFNHSCSGGGVERRSSFVSNVLCPSTRVTLLQLPDFRISFLILRVTPLIASGNLFRYRERLVVILHVGSTHIPVNQKRAFFLMVEIFRSPIIVSKWTSSILPK